MDQLLDKIYNKAVDGLLIKCIFSGAKSQTEFKKVMITPFYKKNELQFQVEYHKEKKVLHKNITTNDIVSEIRLQIPLYKNSMIFTDDIDYNILVSKKGKIKILKQKPTMQVSKINLSHNKKKNYIINEYDKCDFLIHLGVMNKDGKVVAKRYNKFRQINKFLEIVEDSISCLNMDKTINIIDFGCGKAYLTFALYYYLVKIKNYNVNIIGLDLKDDVIDFCNGVAKELDYRNLKFLKGDIRDYNGLEQVDMVLTLHACNTATDAALIKSVNWGAKIILSVPCCQHELFNQIENDVMAPMLKHGLIKERLSSLITDSMRASILEINGYDVSIIEFVALEHTPKNLMIKALYTGKTNEDVRKEYDRFSDFWNINSYLEQNLLKPK